MTIGLKYLVIASCCVVTTIVTIIIIATSVKQIEADEIGIIYDNMTEQMILDSGNKAFTEGRYILTPSSNFIIYKRTLQTLDYENAPISCLSAEGLQMSLRITIQYQIIQTEIMNILTQYGLEATWQDFLNSIARSALKTVCSKYFASDYFQLRAGIEKDMLNTTRVYFNLSNAYATIELVNLRNVQHPAFFVTANQDKQAIEQEKDRLIRDREDLLTRETTILLKAQEDTKIKLINANATARAIIEKAKEEITAILGRANATAPAIIKRANDLAPAENKKWIDRGKALSNIWSQMDNTTLEEFIDGYLHYRILTSQGNKKIMSLPIEQSQASLLNLLVAKL